MDSSLLIGSLQLIIAAFQLKLDHFSKTSNEKDNEEIDNFHDLGDAIRILEFALAETMSYVGQTNKREPNERLAFYWQEASNSIRKVDKSSELAELTFEKNLYWRNPEFFKKNNEIKLYSISLNNMIDQLRKLRKTHDKLKNKRDLK